MTDDTAMPEDIAALSFEAALAELETIVQKLESGSVDLEKSIDMYARGSLLKAHCETKLKAAEARVEKLVISPDGRPGDAVPFETD
ncbi:MULTISPECIES: exodeoxyribonuclease VII small subunit [unclassified Minwuia]|jgi:exodeoxyribonuclease VII small subunit|uniref:exodeoxyribonuclease VII small subunit n=1 Tax=unclassified Minwuia TaxID=2618799 RepID=UPI00247963AB|nr:MULTISPECIES: exodeoxyribonuclease VII small subunit [unclassified Minwuia]